MLQALLTGDDVPLYLIVPACRLSSVVEEKVWFRPAMWCIVFGMVHFYFEALCLLLGMLLLTLILGKFLYTSASSVF